MNEDFICRLLLPVLLQIKKRIVIARKKSSRSKLDTLGEMCIIVGYNMSLQNCIAAN